ncbi:DKNYY domain-containing protein [Tamlana sp. 2_MG-2023]|uniref:DKNYY domain-containing protein n=1 Tax=unclassified Tamlana TaxID=2614803 RepID=UPI0026E34A8A|nr:MULTISPECIES: DKNYY domain-containing protein [unclassified Tamlana]MDO6761438.1 DKNYY domain-containing protein [Tamlana sp. 2_MG-2023]MDO6792118.1 DKNYY domain-containing protein [Tamlana sp. 1_MG-2023]
MSTSSIVILIIVLCSAFLFKSCKRFSGHVNENLSDNYYYNGDKSAIQYSPMGNWFELGNTKMEADVSSFEVLSNDYGKDKSKIFFKSVDVTSEVDYVSFYVEDRFAFDQNHVYVAYEHMSYALRDDLSSEKTLFVIERADPESFENIDFDWNKDGKTFFFKYQAVDVDYDSFEILNEASSKDKNTVYFHNKNDIIASAVIDVSTVRVINAHYIADINGVYSYNFMEEDAEKALTTFPVRDLESIKVLKHNYLIIDDAVYYDNILMPSADGATFHLWKDTYYGADKNQVYFLETPIEGVDVETFHVFEYRAYSKDKNNAYYNGKLIKGVDLATFGPESSEGFGLFKDKNHVYDGDEIVTD